MNKVMYFLHKHRAETTYKNIVRNCSLELCFKDKNEMILKNEEALVSIKKKYIRVCIYDENSTILEYAVRQSLE